MLNVLNAASIGGIDTFLKALDKIDTKLFKNPSKIKNMVRKHYLDGFCLEKGIENEDMKKQLKCSLNKSVSYKWIETPTGHRDSDLEGEISD